MLRFWLFGAIISTASVNAIYTNNNCIGKCVSTSTSNQYLPHQQCDKYCVCVSGQPQIFDCKLGNHWSQEHEICTHPAEAKCQIRSNTKIFINALDQGCKTECPQNELIFLAHNDCTKYCLCNNNSVTIFTCSEGHFSVKSNICVSVEDAGCIINNSMINTPRRPIELNTTLVITDNKCIGSCPILEDPSHTVYLAHHDCSKYCHCKNGHPIINNCLSSLLFSLRGMRCRSPKDVDCNRVNSTTTINIPPSDKVIKKGCRTQCPRYYNTLIPHKNRSTFCLCRDGEIVILKCPIHYYFSTNCARCISIEKSELINPTNIKLFTSTSLPLSTEPLLTSTEPLPPSTAGMTKEFNNCVENCPDSDSDFYDVYYNISHQECNKYCECHKGNIMKIVECSIGYNFDRFFRICDLSEYAECYYYDNSTFSTTLLSTSSTLLSLSTEPLLPSTIGKTEEFNNCVENCPDSDSDFYDVYYNISHQECNKYCECHKGNIMKIVECSVGYNFDRFFRICDLLKYAECYYHDNFTSSTTLLSSSSTELPVITRPLDDVNQCVGNCNAIEFKSYDTVVNIPHEKCNKYCECHRGEIKVKECPLTHQFDWIHRKCMISENASCLNHTISMTTSSSLSTSSKDPVITFSSAFIDYYDCVEACPSISSVNYDEYVKVPHRDCKKYCECYRGILTVVECPLDSYYDCYFQTCDVFKYATCYNQYTISSTSMPLDPSAAPSEIIENCIGKCSEGSKMNYAIFLRHKQCQKFCECFEGRLTVKSCPPNSYFNSNLGLCDQLEYVECKDAIEIPPMSPTTLLYMNDCLGVCVPDKVHLIPHIHCTKYCECDLGKLEVKSCSLGTYFDGFTKRCEFTEFDDCTKIPETSVTILSEYVDGCAEECPYFTDETHVDFIPHNQCEKYCLCGSWEKPLVMSCGPNSHFNPTRKECDDIENAGCKGIANMNTKFAPHIVPLPTEDCTDCHDKNKFYTILLKISGIKNGSEIDLKIGNPDNTVSVSNGDDNEMNSEEFHSLITKDIDEERIFPKDPNGLVTILANLREKAQCIGKCPEPYVDMTTVYLKHQNCRRACKCSINGPRVMECHNNFYWNPVTQECDPIIYTGCIEVVDNVEDEPESDSTFDGFRKVMGW